MWFFKTENGTFCIRYLREGYGLFIDEDYLTWQKDAESVAKLVSEQRTGHRPWDSLEVADCPNNLGEWLTLEDIQPKGLNNPSYDPFIVPLDCSCGNQIRESVGRIRTICKFRCPECNREIRVGAEQMRAIMEEVKGKSPNGFMNGRPRQ
jgi:hypothetical protein